MKKFFRKMLVVAMLTTATSGLIQAQTTVTFKPGSAIGSDAMIMMLDNGCIPSYDSITPANVNYGDFTDLAMVAWTWYANGCSTGTQRSLLKFDQLSTIPANAYIISAQLNLYGGNSTNSSTSNNYYPGCPINNTNPAYIQQVTSNWAENTVTWNTQPNITTTNQIIIPASTLQWNENYSNNSTNLRNMVQNMVSNGTNYGFMFRLQTEIHYRSRGFASSDNVNSSLWPELIVTYEICDPDFTYCLSTSNPYEYIFTPNMIGGYHQWIIDGNFISNDSSLNYTLTPGDHEICHLYSTQYTKCEKCFNICVSDNGDSLTNKKSLTNEDNQIDVAHGKVPPMDAITDDQIKVYPNPSSDNWNVILTSENAESVDVIVTDCSGRVVSNDKKNLTKGDNSFVIDGSKLPKGIYVLEIKGGTINVTQKLSKN